MMSWFRTADLISVPGCLTLSRAGFAAWFPFLVDSPRLALAVVATAGLTDLADGWYARRFHITSSTGAVIDPIMDKLFATSVMVSLLAWGKLTLLEAVLLNMRELGELLLLLWLTLERRARSIRANQLGSNFVGKLTTALQFGALFSALLAPGQLTWWMTATATTGAFAVFVYYTKFRAELARADARSLCGQ